MFPGDPWNAVLTTVPKAYFPNSGKNLLKTLIGENTYKFLKANVTQKLGIDTWNKVCTTLVKKAVGGPNLFAKCPKRGGKYQNNSIYPQTSPMDTFNAAMTNLPWEFREKLKKKPFKKQKKLDKTDLPNEIWKLFGEYAQCNLKNIAENFQPKNSCRSPKTFAYIPKFVEKYHFFKKNHGF